MDLSGIVQVSTKADVDAMHALIDTYMANPLLSIILAVV